MTGLNPLNFAQNKILKILLSRKEVRATKFHRKYDILTRPKVKIPSPIFGTGNFKVVLKITTCPNITSWR